ncbi:MAG: 3-deoxy-7-phosphoheptulonate synthase [Calditrichaeota bacterium]|nr:MAG: 3-deoxy-7-phosphoheptulonate synthase [Calditrichota bacterium]MBL1204486.1 3-deoxy-7-phosphoheptulonate synthase [Calditrichota bacterium]NOG44315.1 3-deoxy-7-phosphoheptulonate synthase [Calditrichota bacterium]
MVIIIEKGAKEKVIEAIIKKLDDGGFDIHRSTGVDHTILGVIGNTNSLDIRDIQLMEGVADTYRISAPYKLVSREFKSSNTVFKVKDVEIGGKETVIMAGPCSIESKGQIMRIAERVAKAGAKILRGGAFKPRSSPYSFQGLGEKGLEYMREAADKYNLAMITEVMDKDQIELVSNYTDIIQVGARNMQNFSFIRALGKSKIPVFLKRGISATIEEWLMSAEYIISGGNKNVIFCERGIRTFETYTRNTMDISAVPIIQKLSHLPIFADPSHGTGLRNKVIPMARAAVAAGANGLMIEVHDEPDKALSDGAQSLYPDQFDDLMKQIRIIAEVIGRKVAQEK